MSKRLVSALLAMGLFASTAWAQSNVSTTNKWAWSENTGFLNWRDAGSPAGSQGVILHRTFLSGFVWSENVGWINLGDGTPADGTSYRNTSGDDFGVNRNPSTNIISGLAWGENIGWINFAGGDLASPPQPARFDPATSRLRGFAWSPNAGWINLDSSTVFVSFSICRADFNGDGLVNSQDFFDFLSAFFTDQPRADFNSDALINSQDFFDFLGVFFPGC